MKEVNEIYKLETCITNHPSISIKRNNIWIEKNIKNQFAALRENNFSESNQSFLSAFWLPYNQL